MKKHVFLLMTAVLFVAAACGPRQEPAYEADDPDDVLVEESPYEHRPVIMLVSETHRDFFWNLKSLCGKSFEGEQIYRSHHASGWEDYEMIMHVDVCEEDRVLIPFHVGEDESRTWMFLVEDGQLRLRHDHRHPDGTPEDETLYGGYADDTGTEFEQHFPADAYTAEIIDGGGGNVWTIRFDEAMTTFTYRLERDGEKRMRVDFDLTNPL